MRLPLLQNSLMRSWHPGLTGNSRALEISPQQVVLLKACTMLVENSKFTKCFLYKEPSFTPLKVCQPRWNSTLMLISMEHLLLNTLSTLPSTHQLRFSWIKISTIQLAIRYLFLSTMLLLRISLWTNKERITWPSKQMTHPTTKSKYQLLSLNSKNFQT